MKIVIDTDQLKNHRITPNEALLLYGHSREDPEKYYHRFCNIDHLIRLGYIDSDEVITDVGRQVVVSIFDTVDEKIPVQETDTRKLAVELIEIFPKGIKSGGLPVRSNVMDVEKKIIKFMKTYPEYTEDQIKNALKGYVREFEKKGYMFMQTLSYLIFKDNSSNLASLIGSYDETVENGGDRQWGSLI